jgi:hypothetical protein
MFIYSILLKINGVANTGVANTNITFTPVKQIFLICV